MLLCRHRGYSILIFLIFSVALTQAPTAWAVDTADVHSQLEQLIAGFKGHVALAAKNLQTGETIAIHGEEKVQTASVIKLPIMVEAFYQVNAKQIGLDRLLLLDSDNKVSGSGILQDLSNGLILPLRDALLLMIDLSDNTAANMVIDTVGIDAVNARMRALGLKNTRLFKKVFLPPPVPSAEQKKYGLGVTTPEDMERLLEMLARGELVDPSSSEAMISILKKQRDQDQIPRFITYDAQGIDSAGVQVADKTGALDDVRNDVGLVFTRKGTYAMAIFAWGSPDRRWTPDNTATLLNARIAKTLFDHFESAERK